MRIPSPHHVHVLISLSRDEYLFVCRLGVPHASIGVGWWGEGGTVPPGCLLNHATFNTCSEVLLKKYLSSVLFTYRSELPMDKELEVLKRDIAEQAFSNGTCPRCTRPFDRGALDSEGTESNHCTHCGCTVYRYEDGTFELE